MENMQHNFSGRNAVIIGAGPAGLTASYELVRNGYLPLILEKDRLIGGIARTEKHRGFCFDMGGHRFFTKSDYVNSVWTEMLGPDFMVRQRQSRIYYNKKLLNYPPQIKNTLQSLGLGESARVIGSYFRSKIFPRSPIVSFQDWVTNAFGDRLFRIFFESYTEKVWGIRCSELRAEWAAQRIRSLSLGSAIRGFFTKKNQNVRSLIDSFHYPRLGPGMMWDAMKERIEKLGGNIQMKSDVVSIVRNNNRVRYVVARTENGNKCLIPADIFISSMPLSELILKFDPPAPQDISISARALKYRSYVTVCLIVDNPELFPDNWIYVHEPHVRVARIQNYKNWSPALVADQSKTGLGMEYFCNEGDRFWSMPDRDLISTAVRELEALSICKAGKVIDGVVYRIPKAYPVYDENYSEAVDKIYSWCSEICNLRTIGRNGLHRYNNLDHSMLTGMYAVRSLIKGENYDLRKVNDEQEYLEELPESSRVSDLESGWAA